jgi:5-methyltetrahydrofolate--homocysteine methyltransferase
MDLQQLYDAILAGDSKTAQELVSAALTEGSSPNDLLHFWMIPAMDEVGRMFESGEYFVPEMLLAGRAMKAGMEVLKPKLSSSGVQPMGRVVIGTAQGDLHDIGKNLVASMLESSGFEVFDLGIDVPPSKFIAAIQERKPQLVCLSALLTVTMPAMRTTIEALVKGGVRSGVRVLVGGAPVTSRYAREIGADGYGETAAAAVTLARQFVPRSP